MNVFGIYPISIVFVNGFIRIILVWVGDQNG